MKIAIGFFICIFLFISCRKNPSQKCNIQQVYASNANKVTIANGVWGTVSSVEGNCMPTSPGCNSCCTHCPAQRTVSIYQFTTVNDAITSDPYKVFFDSFNTPLVTQVEADENGFFQAGIPAGKYSIVVIENGRLYSITRDGQGGLSPYVLSSGTTNVNLVMTYKATF